ncbi:basic proline-rich protein-like [Penaeus monodon]|uniref:basic proline-rich protein-like n=1 Tax=Penaeus monodon TaxID=6687 RepID=UPI0018A769E5|nr:basic proline-rich protein-like [Penaeus monodon]
MHARALQCIAVCRQAARQPSGARKAKSARTTSRPPTAAVAARPASFQPLTEEGPLLERAPIGRMFPPSAKRPTAPVQASGNGPPPLEVAKSGTNALLGLPGPRPAPPRPPGRDAPEPGAPPGAPHGCPPPPGHRLPPPSVHVPGSLGYFAGDGAPNEVSCPDTWTPTKDGMPAEDALQRGADGPPAECTTKTPLARRQFVHALGLGRSANNRSLPWPLWKRMPPRSWPLCSL